MKPLCPGFFLLLANEARRSDQLPIRKRAHHEAVIRGPQTPPHLIHGGRPEFRG
jgi:hypothetical protein